jgi:uncharacterized membrane-anchored protein
MAYARSGSTAGANPPVLLFQPMAFGSQSTYGSTIGSTLIGGKVWFYQSTHVQATVGTSDFITDGLDLGMKQGDILFNNAINLALSVHRVTNVVSTSVTLSAGLMISSAS